MEFETKIAIAIVEDLPTWQNLTLLLSHIGCHE